MHSEQFDKGSDRVERKERKSRVRQIRLTLFFFPLCGLQTLPGEYVTPLQDLIDRCECTRGNITDSYCIILITICHWVPLATRSSSSLSPLARSTFHKNNLYFYFFRLTNNVHDIFLFFFFLDLCSLLLRANFLTHSALFRTTIENNSPRRRCA